MLLICDHRTKTPDLQNKNGDIVTILMTSIRTNTWKRYNLARHDLHVVLVFFQKNCSLYTQRSIRKKMQIWQDTWLMKYSIIMIISPSILPKMIEEKASTNEMFFVSCLYLQALSAKYCNVFVFDSDQKDRIIIQALVYYI